MLTLILRHFGFPDCIIDFFSNYLVDQSTQYFWNSFLSGAYNTDVGMEQGFILSSILLTFYITSLIHIFELSAQPLNSNTSIFLFVDDNLQIS